MTRSEIREAIKKVFFEKIESDPLTKKMSFRSKTGSKKYKSLDGKYTFKSRHEVLAYNIFDKERVLDQIKPEDRQFQKTCHKVPDFVWENKKIIIEIAGINETFRPGYWKNLLAAKPCLEKLGYTVYIIDTRKGQYKNYINFYKYLCDLLGFTPKPEIKNDIYSYVGTSIDLVKRNQEIIQYKKDNPKATYKEIADKFNTDNRTVENIISQAGLTTLTQRLSLNQEIIQYKTDNMDATSREIADKFNMTIEAIYRILSKAGFGTSRSQTQAKNQEIIQYKKDNPNTSYQEIADKFNADRSMVSSIFKRAGLSIPKSQTQARNQEIIQYKKDNPKATYKEIADKFNTTDKAVSSIISKAGFSTPQSQTQARNQEIIQYKNNNMGATPREIANKFNIKEPLAFYILKKGGFITPLSQTQDQNQVRNQEIIQYKNNNPKATAKEIADKFNLSIFSIYPILKLKQSDLTNEQSLNHKTMTLKELREIIKKAMQESTIDVPGDPNKLTPQQKSAEIYKARQVTKKPKLGTSGDPVDFI
jgi:DNA-binding CsgD family transcriptional regulator